MARWLFLLISVAFLFAVPSAQAEKKVALIIGNSNYKHVTPLPNPMRDAQAMARMLEKIGFTVVMGTDLDREAMADKLRLFAAKADNADTVLYFYAGHGIQLDGKNYLIPTDADLNNEMDVKLSTLDIDLMLQQTPVTARVKLVLLDACRNNPFKEQIARSLGKTRSAAVGNGLAEMKPTFGTMIAYATGPGEVALDGDTHNSPFTTALLKYLPEAGLEIGQAMTRVRAAVYEDTGNRQLPWENKNLTSDYYLVAPVAAVAAAEELDTTAQTTAPKSPDEDKTKSWTAENGEIILWQAVKDSTDTAEVQVYLDRYGDDGIFANTARKRIETLEAAAALVAGQAPVKLAALEKPAVASPPAFTPDPEIATASASAATEGVLSLGKTDKKILIIKLSSLGFGTRSLSGDFDETTRIALAKWQQARGYPVTGFLNKLQYDALLYDDLEIAPTSAAIEVQPEADPIAAEPTPVKKRYKPVEKKIVIVPPANKKAKTVYVAKEKIVKPKAAAPVKKIVAAPRLPKPAKKVVVAKKAPRPIIVPKVGISIGSGGGLGLSLGF